MQDNLAQFYSRQVIDYKFDASGHSNVTLHISLTNKTANYYASRYELELAGEDPQDISASDANGPLKISVTGSDPVQVNVQFNTPVTGLGKTLNFTLSYRANPAVRHGQVWEINLPRLTRPDAVTDYTLNLIVPPAFGHPAYLSPPPSSSTGTTYSYTKDQLISSGVSGAFGNFQTLSFRISYRLDAPGIVILPSDNPSQRVFFDVLTPHPNSVRMDSTGRWLAEFPAGEITATGQVRLLSKPTTPESWSLAYPSSQATYSSYKDYPVQPAITQWQPPLLLLPFVPAKFSLKITNPNSQAIYSNPVTLPPFGSLTLNTKYLILNPIDFRPKNVTLMAESLPVTYNIPQTLFLPWQLTLALLISLTIITGSLYLQRLFRRRALRR